jgi:hypothetical protein
VTIPEKTAALIDRIITDVGQMPPDWITYGWQETIDGLVVEARAEGAKAERETVEPRYTNWDVAQFRRQAIFDEREACARRCEVYENATRQRRRNREAIPCHVAAQLTPGTSGRRRVRPQASLDGYL